MSGRNKFEALTGKLPAKRRARIEGEKKRLRREMALHEMRASRKLIQVELAKILKVEQPAIARIERRRDMLVSKLKGLVSGMGGELRLVAHFPDGDVVITNFAAAPSAKLDEMRARLAGRPAVRPALSPARAVRAERDSR